MANLDLRNRAPTVERQPDYRLRVTRVYDILNYIPKDPEKLLADAWLDWGSADEQFPECRLVKQDIAGQPENFPDDSKRPPVLTRVFDQIAESAETQVGEPAVEYDQYNNQIITIDWIQFASADPTYQVPGQTAAPAPFDTAILKDESRTNDGDLQRIRRIYTTGGVLSDNEQLRFNSNVVIRTITSLNEIPATPAGFTLVTNSTDFVRGLPVYTRGYTRAGPGGGGSGSTGAVVGNDITYSQSIDQGQTAGVTVQTIKYVSTPAITTNPITTPAGFTLISVGYDDDSGYRLWTATYAKGVGIVTNDVNPQSGGALVTYHLVGLDVAPTTPAPTIGGVVTLTGSGSRFADGYTVYDYTWAEANGEVSRAFTDSQGGVVDFDPDDPTAGTGAVTCSVQFLSALSVTEDPTTPPSGFVRIGVGQENQNGYKSWTVRYAYGSGIVTDEVSYGNGGLLVNYSRTSLGSVPSTPDATIGGTVVLVSSSSRNSDGYVIYEYQWAEGIGEVGRSFSNSSGGPVDFNPDSPTDSVGSIVCTIRYLSPLSVTEDPTTGPAGFVRTSVDQELQTGYQVWTVRYGYGYGLIVDDVSFKNQGKLAIYHKVSLGVPPTNPNITPGSISVVTVTDGGSGYTTPPTISFTGGGGSGATAVAVMLGTSLASISLVSSGSGYTAVPAVVLSGGGGSGATAVATLTPTSVASFTLVAGGSGYTSVPTVTITGGGGSGAAATAVLAGRGVASIAITNAGSGYTSAPTVTLTGGGGSGATAVAVLSSVAVASVALGSAGSGYDSAPTVAVTGGGGSGAAVTADISPTAVQSVSLTAGGSYATSPTVTLTGGGGSGATATAAVSSVVNSLTLTNPGSGYTSVPTVTLTGGGGSGATAVATITAGGTIASFTLTNAGSGYTSEPGISVSGGGGSGGAATASLSPTSVSFVGTPNGPYSWGTGITPTISFTGGGGGSGATAVATMDGFVYGVAVTGFGSGYTSVPTVVFSGGGGTGAAAFVTINPSGQVTSIRLTRRGTGYTSTPTATVTGGGGSGASIFVYFNPRGVASVAVTNGGSGYTKRPLVTYSGISGAGQTFATLAPVSIASIAVSNPGSGYTSAPTVTLQANSNVVDAPILASEVNASGAVSQIDLCDIDDGFAGRAVVIGGFGYVSTPTISIIGGGGSGATATASISGGAITSVSVTNGGSGYTASPTTTATAPGLGSGATATSVLTSRVVDSLTLTNAGTGYSSAPTVVFSGGGGSGTTATAGISMSGVTSLTLTNPGSGYTSAPAVVFSGGGGSGASATSALVPTTVASLTLAAGGSGYTSTPTVTITGGGGSGATGTLTLATASIASLIVTTPGSGYTSAPTVGITGGGGSGGAGTASLSLTVPVDSITITNGGSGYTSSPTVAFTGGGGSGAMSVAILTPTDIASLSLISPGGGYTSFPTVTISGGGGSGATGDTTLSPTSVGSVIITDGGTGYVSDPDVLFSTGAATAVAMRFAEGLEVILINQSLRTEDGYNIYDYTWAAGLGVIATKISQREDGLRMETWLSIGQSFDDTIMKPAGVLIDLDSDDDDGYDRWTATCLQNKAGASPIAGDGVASATMTSAGNTDYGGSAPTVVFSSGGGSGAAGYAVMDGGFVTGITITSPGSGYTSAPIISLTPLSEDAPTFVAVLDNVAVQREKMVNFQYPGRAQAVNLVHPDVANSHNLDIQLSPPIDCPLIGIEQISYTTENTISNVPYPWWQPIEWATIFAQWIAQGSAQVESKIEGLRGYRAVGGVSEVTQIPANDHLVSILGSPVGKSGSIAAYLTVSGGPPAPDNQNWTMDANVELAFTDVDGTQYFRKTVTTAFVPPQNPLPTLTSVAIIATDVTDVTSLKAVVTVGEPAGVRTNNFNLIWTTGGVIWTKSVRPTLVRAALAADTTFFIKPSDYATSTNECYWSLN